MSNMNIQTLLKLAQNPFFKLSPEQLKQLEDYRQNLKHDPSIKKHDPISKKHNPKLKDEKDV